MPSYSSPEAMEQVQPPLMHAIIALLKASGMKEFQIRYDEEQQPVVWVAVAIFKDKKLALPGKEDVEIKGRQCGADFTPIGACRDLAERCITGGVCTHCHRMIEVNFGDDNPAFPPEAVCYRMYDGNAFRRSCETNVSN